MSNNKAIAAVTKTLQAHLFKELTKDPALAGATVTTKPPDRARTGAGSGRQLNLFLYRTSIDAAWRNEFPPGLHTSDGAQVAALPLILSYLLTAYGENDDEVESHHILGLAMSAFNDGFLLSRAEISTAFPGSGLENQTERVRITPHPIPMDEISRLWATFHTGYRNSVSYDVAVVLIESSSDAFTSPPVLARGQHDAGPIAVTALPPRITKVVLPHGVPAARPGDTVELVGTNLAGVASVNVTGALIAAARVLPVIEAAPTRAKVDLPGDGDLLPAGTVLLTPLAPTSETPGNTVALRLAPTLVINNPPLRAQLTNGGATITVGCKPPVLAGQTVALMVGDRLIQGSTPTKTVSELTFQLTKFDPGRYLLRLRVDDQDSLPVDPANPISFNDNEFLTLT